MFDSRQSARSPCATREQRDRLAPVAFALVLNGRATVLVRSGMVIGRAGSGGVREVAMLDPLAELFDEFVAT